MLILTGCQLSTLPPEVGELDGLKKLKMGVNNFVRLPECVGRLVKLEELELSGNKLGSIDAVSVACGWRFA